jgi:hypothetical protein
MSWVLPHGRSSLGIWVTLMEIRGRLAADKTFAASISALWRFFDRHGISFKKTLHTAEQDREDVKAAREEWRERQPSIDTRQLVFIDETGTSTNIRPSNGHRAGAVGRQAVVLGGRPQGYYAAATRRHHCENAFSGD